MFNIDEELNKLPKKPGVYMMKDNKKEIIYVGKAKNLRNRVRQYFQSSRTKTPKVNALVKNIKEFEHIIVDNEVEALILEANLIKKHRPKYNILLRDDKQYPYIKITKERFPRVIRTRKVLKDGGKYFGPYPNSYAVNDTLEIIRNLYPIRTCKLNLEEIPANDRPCLNYHIGRCLAPCQGYVKEEDYDLMIDEIILFLNGKEESLVGIIEEKMEKAAKNLDFEKAARYRDQIDSLNLILEKQKIVSTSLVDRDVIGMAKGIEDVCVQIFFIRAGKIVGREHFILPDVADEPRGEILSSFVKQFYLGTAYIPKEVIVEKEFKDIGIVKEWLEEKRGTKVTIHVPKRGEKSELMDMVRKNASETLKQFGDRIKIKQRKNKDRLSQLKNILHLEKLPYRIEAFDISNIQGVEPVGSMVVFENGVPKKSDYRRFKIRTVMGPDDYASMEEIIRRRFKRGLEEKNLIKKRRIDTGGFSTFPDLVMIDGGKGQVNVAKKVLKDLGIEIPICGMVKDDHHNTRGLIYKDLEVDLSNARDVFNLVTRIQDEAHRFAISYHRSLRSKKMFRSVLDNIKGIGEKRKKSLLKHFGSIDKIKQASVEELVEAESMNKRVAENVYNYFRKK